MTDDSVETILVHSPRYGEELATSVLVAGFAPHLERLPEDVVTAFSDESLSIVVVDARGAMEQGLAVARALGPSVETRHGAMLVLLSRTDGATAGLVHDAGATSILISPFGNAAFANALRLAVRHAHRLAEAAASRPLVRADRRRDWLTGLRGSDQLHEDIGARLARPDASGAYLLAIGIGRIAAINAAYGRDIADQALSAVASRLNILAADGSPATAHAEKAKPDRSTPDTPGLVRLAAAEFGILLAENATMADATLLCETIIAGLAEPLGIGDHMLYLPVRIGIAGGRADAAVMIRQASAALAMARSGEAGTITVFRADPAGDPLTRRADLIADLHLALENDEIALLFQPQMTVASGRIAGVEALARWDHRQHGVLSAETLLETAAAAGLAVRLGRHIRRRAMMIAAGWGEALAAQQLSLNVTATDLADPGFVACLQAAIVESGLSSQRLTLEVTEGALLADIDAAVEILGQLRRSGIRIVLDDFGTGYSSLAWMARLPIDGIKLDRSFLIGLIGSTREHTVIVALVALAHQLGLTVTGEGVEDAEQLAAAIAAGCDHIQGFTIATPLRETELHKFFGKWPEALPGQLPECTPEPQTKPRLRDPAV